MVAAHAPRHVWRHDKHHTVGVALAALAHAAANIAGKAGASAAAST